MNTRPAIDRGWLPGFASAVRMVTLSNFTVENTCILSTRLGQYVLDEVGVRSRPQPVWVAAFNVKAWRLAQEGAAMPQWPEDAWSVAVHERGPETTARGWNGHLVLVVRLPGEPRILVDLSADQFDRPQRNLRVGGPVIMGLDGTWTPQDSLSTILPNREDPQTVIEYWPMPPGARDAKAWRDTPDATNFEEELRDAARRIAESLTEG